MALLDFLSYVLLIIFPLISLPILILPFILTFSKLFDFTLLSNTPCEYRIHQAYISHCFPIFRLPLTDPL